MKKKKKTIETRHQQKTKYGKIETFSLGQNLKKSIRTPHRSESANYFLRDT